MGSEKNAIQILKKISLSQVKRFKGVCDYFDPENILLLKGSTFFE
jgi:hypothetical protein